MDERDDVNYYSKKRDKNVKFFSALKVSMGYIFLNAKISFIK